MKTLAVLFLLIPGLLFGKVGPDIDIDAHTAYFTELRMEYAKNPQTSYFPMWRMDPEHEALVSAYRRGDWEEVLKTADSWLRKCPIDADSHLRVAMCYKEKGDFVSYGYHLTVFYGLLNSITSSGDGRTPKTAFKVVSVHEEYSLVQEIGAKVEKQSLVSGFCDKLELSRKNGEKTLVLYFDVSVSMKALQKQLTK